VEVVGNDVLRKRAFRAYGSPLVSTDRWFRLTSEADCRAGQADQGRTNPDESGAQRGGEAEAEADGEIGPQGRPIRVNLRLGAWQPNATLRDPRAQPSSTAGADVESACTGEADQLGTKTGISGALSLS